MKLEKKVQTFEVVEREILKNLLKKDTIDWYFFHEKYKLSPGQLSRSMKKLEAWEYIVIEDDKIHITNDGIKRLIAERNDKLRKRTVEIWQLPQSERLVEKLNVNQFYLPNKNKMKK